MGTDIEKTDDSLFEDGELTEKEIELAKNRFVASDDTIEVILVPQCVKCTHNQGNLLCDLYEEKPENYISNIDVCPSLNAV